MKPRFTMAGLKAAKSAEKHIKAINYSFSPEDAAVDIDKALRLDEIVELIENIVAEAKRDLASNPDWTGPTVRINRGRIKELSNILAEIAG